MALPGDITGSEEMSLKDVHSEASSYPEDAATHAKWWAPCDAELSIHADGPSRSGWTARRAL